MGRPALSDEERRVKNLTRELHEAMQEMRQEVRELQAIHESLHRETSDINHRLVGQVDEFVAARINATCDHWLEQMKEAAEKTIDSANRAGERVRATEARIAGYKDNADMMQHVITVIHRFMTDVVADAEFGKVVAQLVIAQLDSETGGEFAAAASVHRRLMTALDKVNQKS